MQREQTRSFKVGPHAFGGNNKVYIQSMTNTYTKDVTATGCTSQGQAHRFGKWHLLTEKLEKENEH